MVDIDFLKLRKTKVSFQESIPWLKNMGTFLAAGLVGVCLTFIVLWIYLNADPSIALPAQGTAWITPITVFDIIKREWCPCGVWTGRSINFNQPNLSKPYFSPVIIVVLWIGLSSFTLLMLQRPWRDRQLNLLPYLAFICIGWLALDLRWQLDLFQRASQAISQYATFSEDERQAVGPDRAFYPIIREILKHLPQEPTRILILADQPTGALVGRLRYHLLPHNTFGGLTDLPEITNFEGYVLITSPFQQVRYDFDRKLLTNGKVEWPAELILTSRIIKLFHVRRN